MVQKLIVLLMLISNLNALANPVGLRLNWKGDKSENCRHLTEAFLEELRSLAPEHPLELEAADGRRSENQLQSPGWRALSLLCFDKIPSTLELQTGNDRFQFHFLKKAQGFDASDWLFLQEHFLRNPPPEAISLAPSAPEEHTPQLATVSLQPTSAGSPIYKKWWFWSLIAAGVGAGAYAFAHSQSPASSVNVEIH